MEHEKKRWETRRHWAGEIAFDYENIYIWKIDGERIYVFTIENGAFSTLNLQQ